MIINNQYPICEYDTSRNPIIKPADFLTKSLPEKCVITFFRKELEQFAAEKNLSIIGYLNSEVLDIPIYEYVCGADRICITMAFCGAPGAVVTIMTIPPKDLLVCVLQRKDDHSIVFSRFEIIKYMMATVQPEQIQYYGVKYDGSPDFERQQPESGKKSECTMKSIRLKSENMIPKHTDLLFMDLTTLLRGLYSLRFVQRNKIFALYIIFLRNAEIKHIFCFCADLRYNLANREFTEDG